MATHASILAWKSPWTEETGGLQAMGLQRVRYDSFTFHFPASEKEMATHESQGQGSLVGFRLCGHTESDTTEVT